MDHRFGVYYIWVKTYDKKYSASKCTVVSMTTAGCVHADFLWTIKSVLICPALTVASAVARLSHAESQPDNLQGQHKTLSCGIFEIPDLFSWSCWPEARAKTQHRRWAKSYPWWQQRRQSRARHLVITTYNWLTAPAPHLAPVTRNNPSRGHIPYSWVILYQYWVSFSQF